MSQSTNNQTPRSYHTTLDPVHAATACDQFLVFLLASGLVRFSELRAAIADFDTERKDDSVLDELVDRLIERKLLTAWQCDKLRMGKWKGFYMDNYKLLGPAEPHDPMMRNYIAEDTSTRKQVTLDVRYNETTPRIEYSVLMSDS
jgi:hypothetical protein